MDEPCCNHDEAAISHGLCECGYQIEREVTLTGKDIARIFQALCTEQRRLENLSPGWHSQDTVDHCEALAGLFAAIHP